MVNLLCYTTTPYAQHIASQSMQVIGVVENAELVPVILKISHLTDE